MQKQEQFPITTYILCHKSEHKAERFDGLHQFDSLYKKNSKIIINFFMYFYLSKRSTGFVTYSTFLENTKYLKLIFYL